jgi:hypothetical protein
MKILPVGAVFSMRAGGGVDGQRDVLQPIDAFRNFFFFKSAKEGSCINTMQIFILNSLRNASVPNYVQLMFLTSFRHQYLHKNVHTLRIESEIKCISI